MRVDIQTSFDVEGIPDGWITYREICDGCGSIVKMQGDIWCSPGGRRRKVDLCANCLRNKVDDIILGALGND